MEPLRTIKYLPTSSAPNTPPSWPPPLSTSGDLPFSFPTKPMREAEGWKAVKEGGVIGCLMLEPFDGRGVNGV